MLPPRAPGLWFLATIMSEAQVSIDRAVTEVSAIMAIGLWITPQLISGAGAITSSTQTAYRGGGV